MGIEATIESPLAHAVIATGSQSAFARLLGCNQSTVYAWLKGGKQLPPEHAAKVEEATGISRHDLRPDIFGPPPSLPADPVAFEHAR